jgi:hypothetical protein
VHAPIDVTVAKIEAILPRVEKIAKQLGLTYGKARLFDDLYRSRENYPNVC